MSGPPRIRPPVSNVAHDESEAPTLKWNRPAELSARASDSRTSGDASVTGALRQHVRTRVRKFGGEPVRIDRSPESGLRAALTAEEIERFERREKRETLPAPPERDAIDMTSELDITDHIAPRGDDDN